MQGKNGLNIHIQQEKTYQNDALFILGFEKVLKMKSSVIFDAIYSAFIRVPFLGHPLY